VSWDVLVMGLPGDVRSVDDLPADFRPADLGPRADVLARIRGALPAADFTDPSWGVLDGPGYSIEFNVGDSDPVDSIMLHVRGSAEVVDVVADLLRGLDWRAVDCQTGELFDVPAARASFGEWAAYRDRVIAAHQAPRPRRGLLRWVLGR